MKSEFYGTEMFLDNEFTMEYLDICRTALNRPEPDYYETHMVIPMDFWRFLPWAVKGRFKEAMPDEKKVYCKLFPEEHFRCHELLKNMFENKTKQSSIANSGFARIKSASAAKAVNASTAEQYGSAQREAAKGKDWSKLPETMKYHPEWFEADGTLRRI